MTIKHGFLLSSSGAGQGFGSPAAPKNARQGGVGEMGQWVRVLSPCKHEELSPNLSTHVKKSRHDHGYICSHSIVVGRGGWLGLVDR